MSSSGGSTDGNGDKQVKFSLPSSSSSGKMGKVFARSCSTTGVLSSISKAPRQNEAAASASTSGQQALSNIPEDEQKTEQEEVEDAIAKAKAKRASMVKKALRYFEDKSNRSMSEDNLFTRRKNLAVHLGLDEKVSLREIQKINTFSLPVPSSATPFSSTNPPNPRDIVVVEEEDEVEAEEDIKTKDLVRFLGMKDGVTASMASQGRLSDDLSGNPPPKQQPLLPQNSFKSTASNSAAVTSNKLKT